MRGYGQPGERETTQHGTVNDITVPTLRLRQILIFDEILIAALMLLLPIGATLIDEWILPVFLVSIVFVMARNAFDDVEKNRIVLLVIGLSLLCIAVFGVGALFMDIVPERLQQGIDAIWQWPPNIGLFLNRVAFLILPFFIPLFTRIPLLTNYFQITLLDPTWPSPRTARDVEGIQSPDEYDDDEIEEQETQPPIIYQITTNGRKKSHGQPTQKKYGNWFAPKKNPKGLAEFGKAILENRATFSEKGSRKTSSNPKLGALYFGFTQDDYSKLRKIGIDLGLVQKIGNGHQLTEAGIEAMLLAIEQTLGKDAIPKGYENWL